MDELEPYIDGEIMQSIAGLVDQHFLSSDAAFVRSFGLIIYMNLASVTPGSFCQRIGDLRRLAARLRQIDPDVVAHGQAVRYVSDHIGRAMGLPTSDLLSLRCGAAFHDAGKAFLPRAILYKPASLTAEEREHVRLHVVWGAATVAPVRWPEVTAAILLHHERYDGDGAPFGLAGGDIPLFARIIACADAYVSQIERRVYRRSVQPDAALRSVIADRGKHFDPDVVDALASVHPDALLRDCQNNRAPRRLCAVLPGCGHVHAASLHS